MTIFKKFVIFKLFFVVDTHFYVVNPYLCDEATDQQKFVQANISRKNIKVYCVK